jgi:predicted dehydrogenase
MMKHDSEEASPIEVLLTQTRGEVPDVGLPSSPLSESPYDLEIADFCSCLRDGNEPRVTAQDGLAALRIAGAALESVTSGAAVMIDGGGL